MDIYEARRIVRSLRVGDPVTYVRDGRELGVTVTRGLRSADPGGYGHPDSAMVTVGYGPGRWNVEITAASLAAGMHDVRMAGGHVCGPEATDTCDRCSGCICPECDTSSCARQQGRQYCYGPGE